MKIESRPRKQHRPRAHKGETPLLCGRGVTFPENEQMVTWRIWIDDRQYLFELTPQEAQKLGASMLERAAEALAYKEGRKRGGAK